MAYHTPELLLVGAAQNLVLQSSSEPGLPKELQPICRGPEDPASPELYDDVPLW